MPAVFRQVMSYPAIATYRINRDEEGVKQIGSPEQTLPGVSHTTEETLANIFVACKGGPMSMDERVRLKEDLGKTKRRQLQAAFNHRLDSSPTALQILTFKPKRITMFVKATTPTLFKSAPSPSPTTASSDMSPKYADE